MPAKVRKSRRACHTPLGLQAAQMKRPHFGETMTRPPATWLPELLAKVDGFASLKENWDSYGGKPIDSKAIAHAKTLIVWLAELGQPEFTVVPMSSGAIQFEWASLGLEVEVWPSGHLECLSTQTFVTSDRRDLLRYLTP